MNDIEKLVEAIENLIDAKIAVGQYPSLVTIVRHLDVARQELTSMIEKITE